MSATTPNESYCLPLFPLSTAVLPGGLCALRLFEPRYLDMVSDCMKRDTGFGICLIRSGGEAGEPALPFGTGTEVRIVDWDGQHGGSLQITVEGVRKFRVHELATRADDLVRASVEALPAEPSEPVPAELAHLVDVLRTILPQFEPTIRYRAPRWDDAAWVSGRLTELLPLPARTRQFLLELDNPTARLIELNQALK